MTGNWQNVPFTFTANGQQVFYQVISCNNDYRDIELQFAYTAGSGPVTLGCGIQSGFKNGNGLTWAISDVCITFSNTPVRTFLSKSMLGYDQIPNSYISILL